MKKIFGNINLTWPKVIIMAIIIGIYTAIMALIPAFKDTSFTDLAITFEVWIFFGIFIIMNSKSPKDSMLKCFIFFLISQPLIYLVQDLIKGTMLFRTYYAYWFKWTLACLPMGYIGYYMKKDKWWGLLILTPILVLLANEYSTYLSQTIFSFPRHLLTTIFCFATLIIYPLFIFKNKKIKLVGLTISSLLIIAMTILCFMMPPVYKTDILLSGEKYNFDDTYRVYLKDSKYGTLNFRYEEGIESWAVEAHFTKAGTTDFVLESPTGEKQEFEIYIRRDTYEVKEKRIDYN